MNEIKFINLSGGSNLSLTRLDPTEIRSGNIFSDNVNTTNANIDGTLKAREIIVNNHANWPDYVFGDEYNLRTLEDTEKFIMKNGHLPKIPSVREVEEKGVSIGKMQAKLLEKIEELTLYCIELKKEVNMLKADKE